MSSVSLSPSPQPLRIEAPVFRSVACGIDGSPAALEAARQAAAFLEGPRALGLVAVTPADGPPFFAPLPQAAELALAHARRAVAAAGVPAHTIRLQAGSPMEGLLPLLEPRDLLALGCRELAGPSGPTLGPVAEAAMRRAPGSVLVARGTVGAGVLASVLIAVDASPEARFATAAAATLAARHGGHVALVAHPEHDRAHSEALAEDIATVSEATGIEPLVLDEHGPAPRAIAAAAARIGASLIVIGSREISRTVTGVSAHAARIAPCSVLIARRQLAFVTG